MKIAFVTDSYIPIPTGVAVSIATLDKALERMGHDLIIFAPDYPGWSVKEKNVIRLPALFSPFNSSIPVKWPIFGINSKKIKGMKIDIVHSHFFFKPFKVAENIADISKAPLFHTYYKNFKDSSMLEYSRGCDHIITLSKTTESILERKISSKITTLPIGIYTKDFTRYPPEALKKRLGIPTQRKLIIFPARLDDEANMLFLLKSFKLIWKAIDDVHLLVVGGGEKLKYFIELTEKQAFSKYVTYTGFLPKNKLNKIYGSCDLTVYPKLTDPEPLVILESLASGTPVVTVKGLGAQEFVTDSVDGRVSRPDIDDFSEKVIDLLKRDDLRLKMGMKARVNSKRFNARALTASLVSLYNKELSQEGKISFNK